MLSMAPVTRLADCRELGGGGQADDFNSTATAARQYGWSDDSTPTVRPPHAKARGPRAALMHVRPRAQVLGPLPQALQAMFDANPQNAGLYFYVKDRLTLGQRYEGKMDEAELDFMDGLLAMDPAKRLTGEQVGRVGI
jgi:hypothetical protein